jgi:hypothetical protein
MKTSLIACFALLFSLPLACSAEDDPDDPLARPAGFCEAWATNACQKAVTEACNADSVEDCERSQTDFCLKILPDNYSGKRASECLAAVKNAYKDGDLTAEELGVVRRLAAPCNQLSKGTSDEGEACVTNDDCDTSNGFSCIIKMADTEGTCAKPQLVSAGQRCAGAGDVCEEGNFCNGKNCIAYAETDDPCVGDYECKPEDHCVKDTADAEEGTCQVRAGLNDECASDEDCSSHYCAATPDPDKSICASKIRLSLNDPLCNDLR